MICNYIGGGIESVQLLLDELTQWRLSTRGSHLTVRQNRILPRFLEACCVLICFRERSISGTCNRAALYKVLTVYKSPHFLYSI